METHKVNENDVGQLPQPINANSLTNKSLKLQLNINQASSQDDSIGKHDSPLCTTTSKLQPTIEHTSLRTIRIKLNGSLTITKLKKPHPFKLVGGVQSWKGMVPHPHVVDKNWRGISWEQGVPTPHQAPQAHGCKTRKRSPHTFWLQNHL